MVQPSLTRLEDEPYCYRALNRAAMAVRRRPRAASSTTLMQNGAKAFADFLSRALVISLFSRIWLDLSGNDSRRQLVEFFQC